MSKKNPTVSLLLAVIVLCALSLMSACRSKLIPMPENQTIQVVRTVDPILALPHFVTAELKYFEENKLTIDEIPLYKSETKLTPSSTNPTIYLTDSPSAAQIDFPAVMIGQLAKGDLVLAGREPDTLFAWDHLEKRTVLIPRHNAWEAQQATLAFQKQQLRPNFDFIMLSNIPDDLRINAFVYGTGDYLITNLSTALQLQAHNQATVIALMDNATGGTLGAGILTPQDTLKQHATTLQAYINSVYKGQLWINQHSNHQIAKLVVSNFPQYSTSELVNLISRYRSLQVLTRTLLCNSSIKETHNQIVQLDDNNLRRWEIPIDDSLARKAYQTIKLPPPEPKNK